MEFIFWQGIISIHQQAFLEALAMQPGVTKVVLVVAESLSAYRKDMGWEVPEMKGVTVITAPAHEQAAQLVRDHAKAVHVMGGIRVGAMMALAMDECIRHKCRLGIMTEPYNNARLKGRLRAYKYTYYKLRYAKHIQFVLAIGRQGVHQFIHHGYSKERIFPWAYFIDVKNAGSIKSANDIGDVRRIIYAGRIEEGKGIYRFTEKLLQAPENCILHIYGTGPDEQQLKQLIIANDAANRIQLFPFLKHEELVKRYGHYDWVVLPSSSKDGWGVIISEGLLCGLKALCSSICGASWVIKDGDNGLVFDWDRPGSCELAISTMLNNDSFAAPRDISTRAQRTISGTAGAAYFIKIVDSVYTNKERPGIPWE